MSAAAPWTAIDAATRRVVPRVPLRIDGQEVGSVAVEHLQALRGLSPALRVDAGQVLLLAEAAQRSSVLAELNAALRARGLIRAWRDEPYPLPDPRTQRVLAVIERASSRFWGTLTYGAHCTGWVAGPAAQAPQLWVAQRAFDKATDPGAFDNLVGGGVPQGQTPFETLLREGWEEAGLGTAVMRRARAGRVLKLERDIPEGLQFEWIHAYDLELAMDELPCNQDGEVHAFTLHAAHDALAIAAGSTMTVDASLVTLEFALRQRLLGAPEQAALERRAASLWVAGA